MRNLIGSSLQPCIQSLLSLQKIFFQKISHPYKDHLRIIGPLQRPFAIFEDPTQNTPCEFFQVRNSPFHLEGLKVLRDLMIRIFQPTSSGQRGGQIGQTGSLLSLWWAGPVGPWGNVIHQGRSTYSPRKLQHTRRAHPVWHSRSPTMKGIPFITV